MKPRLISQPASPPPPLTAVTGAFERAGYHVRPTEKSRYYMGMVELLGRLEAAALFREPIGRLFFDAQARKGREFTVKDVLRLTRPGDGRERLFEHVYDLADRQILLRGFNLHCPNCDLNGWYDLTQLAERVPCQGCRALLQPPIDQLEFSYRLNHVFVQGVKQGAITVLLTALLLQALCPGEFIWQAGCEVVKGGHKTDVDLIARCGGRLALAECKDDLTLRADGDAAALHAQLQRTLQVARDVHADAFLFATLTEQAIPAAIVDFLQRAHEAGPPSVLLLIRDDLLFNEGDDEGEAHKGLRDLLKPSSSH